MRARTGLIAFFGSIALAAAGIGCGSGESSGNPGTGGSSGGTAGTTGSAGNTGTTGSAGASGAAGASGSAGATGSAGSSATGSAGSTGSGGTTGSAGATGSAGVTGSAGSSATGSAGATGSGSGGSGGSGGSTGAGGAGQGGRGGAAGGGGGAAGGSGGRGGAAGGNAGAAGGATGSGGTTGTGGASGFSITSPNHADGAKFNTKYTCNGAGLGQGVIPELDWTGVPAGTKSFVLTFIDTTLGDASPMGQHWAMYNIPWNASTMVVSKIPEGTKTLSGDLANAKQVAPLNNGAFLAPCATSLKNNMDDQYAFTLYALSTDTLPGAGSSVATVVTALKSVTPLGKAILTGHAGLNGK